MRLVQWRRTSGVVATLALLVPLASAQRLRGAPPALVLDPFRGSALDPSWSVLNPALASVQVAGGELRLTPAPNTPIWFMDGEGVLVYRPVTGDFTATTRVHAQRASNPALPPDVSYRLGGLLARDPGSSAGARNSVHVALGAGVPGTEVCVEDKTTVDSVSVFALHPFPAPDGELRLRRRGATFEYSVRPLGGVWTLIATRVRADLPATLDVGLMAYSASNPPDLAVSFERFLLEP